jgi:phage terminase small subunit
LIVEKKPVKRVKAGTSKASAADKRAAFVEAYFANNQNGRQAAIVAGYASHSADVTAARLLRDARVLAKIESRRTEVVAATELSTEKTIREVRRLAYVDPRGLVKPDGTVKSLHELDDDTAAAVAQFEINEKGEIKYKFWDKNSALDKALKVQGLYEKDNAQTADPLRELIKALGGAVIGPKRV